MSIGERIKKSREEKGLLQTELAEAVKVKSAAVISNWERDLNKPNADQLIMICKALDIKLSYLLDYYGEDITDSFSLDEYAHIKKYRQLNPEGQRRVDDYTEDLVQGGRYKKGTLDVSKKGEVEKAV